MAPLIGRSDMDENAAISIGRIAIDRATDRFEVQSFPSGREFPSASPRPRPRPSQASRPLSPLGVPLPLYRRPGRVRFLPQRA